MLGLQQLWSITKHEAVVIFAHNLHLKPEFLLKAVSAGCECDNRISNANFVIVFRSNDGSILLSF